MSILVIGDVHAKVGKYYNLVSGQHWGLLNKYKGVTSSIQVGDFGFERHHNFHIDNVDPSIHKVLMGNHDFIPFLDAPHSLGDYSYDDKTGIFTVRGAHSIDKQARTEGLDWFESEEIPYMGWYDIIDEYERVKPRFVITHEAPLSVRTSLFGYTKGSITSRALEELFSIHKPDLSLIHI